LIAVAAVQPSERAIGLVTAGVGVYQGVPVIIKPNLPSFLYSPVLIVLSVIAIVIFDSRIVQRSFSKDM
jgi:hypothetical protein